MSSNLDSSEVAGILEAALDRSFANIPPLPQAAVEETPSTTSPPPSAPQPPAPASAPAESSDSANPDAWKDDYEAQLQTWRAQSAEAREKAEKERAKWEEYRKTHPESAKPTSPLWETSGLSGVIKVPSGGTGSEAGSSSTATSASTTTLGTSSIDPSAPLSGANTGTGSLSPPEEETATDASSSHKWEEVPSVSSSFPSMSFPSQIDTPPHHPSDSKQPNAHHLEQDQPQQRQPPPPPVSVTLSIFDSTLSTRTRLAAFASALTVNLLLPFVNGVMLGFGEIFAKNVVMGWLGWGVAPVASGVGIRAGSREKRPTLFK